jgi:aminoglycoside phosphotransferase (APT) family kinase protein
MAVINKLDPRELAQQLAACLAARMPEADQISVNDVRVPPANGLSNETVLFTACWRESGGVQRQEMVARVAPAPGQPAVYGAYDLGLQFRVMDTLASRTDLPIPRPLFVEEDPAVIGAPFLVMERVSGRTLDDDPPFTTAGWLTDLEPERVATLSDNALRVMGDVHAVDLPAVGLDFLTERSSDSGTMDFHVAGIDQQIDCYERWYQVVSERNRSETLEAGFEWLKANRPSDPGPPVLLWGDARVGNMIFSADLSVAALLDWEQVHVGPAATDVGWSNFMMRHHTDGIGAPIPRGFPAHEAVGERYEELTGRPVGDLRFYEVYGGVRVSVLIMRAVQLLVDAGALPPDSPMVTSNPALHLVAQLADLPRPQMPGQIFLGQGMR